MRIVVVGAGLAGLTAALCLVRAGHSVTVLERQPRLSATGGILNLRPSAVKLLRSHGLWPQLEATGKPLSGLCFRMLSTGKVIRSDDHRDHEVHGEGLSFATLRPLLGKILLDAALAAGAVIRYNATVTALDEDEKEAQVSVTAAGEDIMSNNIETLQADLVLVADGIRSRLRKTVLSDCEASKIEPVFTGATQYFTEVSANKLTASALAAFADPSPVPDSLKLTEWIGPNISALSVPVEAIGGFHIGAMIMEQTEQTTMWDEHGDGEHVKNVYRKTASAEMCEALQLGKRFDRWRLAYLPSLPRWTSLRKGPKAGAPEAAGRIALLGDSAHAVLPSGGAGISITMEDVWVLVELLSKYGRKGKATVGDSAGQAVDSDKPATAEDVPQLLCAWESICRPRAERVREFSLFNARSFVDDGKLMAESEKALQKEKMKQERTGRLPEMDMNAQWSTLAFSRWISGYNPPAEAQRYLES